ncbi:MAG: hypothetical protein A2039_05830 [Candidatus Melainabacteria bacterium GWA2_34_9]|nr:MAG: hypothetical protein A2039_05830 [Candidatus Melainabacteria bacterium GWA2_34_9]
MKKITAKFLLGIFSVFLLINLCFCTSVSAKSHFVIKQIIPDSAGKLILVTGTGNQDVEFKTIKLSNPDRLVVDINNAMLLGSKKSININNEDIKDLRIAQFSSDPDIVRLVLTANTNDVLKKIKIRKNQNTILLDLNELKPTNIAETPLYKDREISEYSEENITAQKEILVNLDINKINTAKDPSEQEKEALIKSLQDKIDHNLVLKKVKHFGNRVIISGTGILSITEPMILENPKRLAFDIHDSTVKSSELLQPISLRNGDFLRIGQFDNNTVRIVIETPKPETYKTIISPDMQSLLIAPENEVSFLEFPDSDSIGEIRDIKIINQDKKTTKIVIISAKPLIHNLKHNNFADGLCLDFYNLKQPKKEVIYNLPRTGQFHGINFEGIERYPNGSRWLFPLNRTTKVQSKLSLDARVLEITLKDVMPVSSWRSNYKLGVVLDAGHGGQEPGAIRAGNYEKNITIDITQRVKTYLKQAGINVIMTREEDETVSLKQRAAITNTEDPDVFVSIHINSSENLGVRGLETYYYTPQSKALAQSVHAKMVNNINSPDRGIRTARFYVIRNTAVPAILAEVGYLSNDSERYSILTEERKDATARAIANGIINYLKSKKSR